MMNQLNETVLDDQLAHSEYTPLVSVYDYLMWPLEAVGLRTLRRFLVAHAHGKVLEVGVGTGANLPFYSGNCHLTAIDAENRVLNVVQQKVSLAHCPVTLMQMDTHQLAFPGQSFDAVVITLVLCSVLDPKIVLGEVRRVLKPSGQLLLIEHVLSPNRLIGCLQDWLNPTWHQVVCGCNLNRDTVRVIQDAGFGVVYTRGFLAGLLLFSVYETDEISKY